MNPRFINGRAFDPAFDFPTTVDEALQVLEKQGEES